MEGMAIVVVLRLIPTALSGWRGGGSARSVFTEDDMHQRLPRTFMVAEGIVAVAS